MVNVSGCSRATVSSEKPREADFQRECVWITAALLFVDVYKSGDAPKDTGHGADASIVHGPRQRLLTLSTAALYYGVVSLHLCVSVTGSSVEPQWWCSLSLSLSVCFCLSVSVCLCLPMFVSVCLCLCLPPFLHFVAVDCFLYRAIPFSPADSLRSYCMCF